MLSNNLTETADYLTMQSALHAYVVNYEAAHDMYEEARRVAIELRSRCEAEDVPVDDLLESHPWLQEDD